MKFPYAIYVSGSILLFCSTLQQFNKVYMEENATPLLKGFNLFMLVFAGKLVYWAVTYSEYLSMQ